MSISTHQNILTNFHYAQVARVPEASESFSMQFEMANISNGVPLLCCMVRRELNFIIIGSQKGGW
ncbi:hypothetical protein VARIO8X_60345 [Burkholderiales bacterium 8X]|nr:hypothetical protein VARIO8X_60345 [Burkholderiales bacterium 8X]